MQFIHISVECCLVFFELLNSVSRPGIAISGARQSALLREVRGWPHVIHPLNSEDMFHDV